MKLKSIKGIILKILEVNLVLLLIYNHKNQKESSKIKYIVLAKLSSKSQN